MEQLERIRRMEACLTEGQAAADALEQALDAYTAAQEKINALAAYYGSEDWRQDFADDEAGKLPPELKRGVLSEDLVYDLLNDNRALAFRLLETAGEVLRNLV